MADERVDSEIVSQFLLNTCRLHPRLTKHGAQAAWRCAELATLHPDDDVEADRIPLTTGSVAEFYIEPMLPLVGDIDMMHYMNTLLAIPRGHPPPTQLPAEFHDYLKVYEIIDSHLSGYVYLKLRYLLTYCPDDEKYNYVECDQEVYMGVAETDSKVHGQHCKVHGPAAQTVYGITSMLPVDVVACLRCLSWPPQAADWPTRHRNYDWPGSATVDRVVNNGCDVVQVAHRQCRQHEWMGKRQWRLSFSRAEISLINSWMPVQQIVYHMLRFFLKAKRMTDSGDITGTKILSNYHIKTLMLWACEKNPRSWWTDDLNLIRTCVELLHTLAVWLSEARCQHYFIHDCNLLDHVDNSLSTSQLAVSVLMTVTETSLCDWFINSYIRHCAQLCPQHIARLFHDVSNSTRLQNAVTEAVDWRLNKLTASCYTDFLLAHILIVDMVSRHSLTVPSCLCLMRELSLIEEDLLVYFVAVVFLLVAIKISRNTLTDELLDVLLSTICLQSNPVRHRRIARHSSLLSLSQAAKLMKVVANNSRSTLQLIEIELSKAYLHRALRSKDSDSDSIYCLTNVYLAVLYYTTGQYQTAIDHCTLVMRSQYHSQCSSHVVQGELLPKIDDDIDTVLGLAVFYQYVLSAALNQQQTQYVSVFTTELFGYYLHIKFLAQIPSSDVCQKHVKCITDTHYLSLCDVLVFKLLNYTVTAEPPVCRRSMVGKCGRFVTSETGMNTSELAELLQQSAVEHMKTYRQFQTRAFDISTTVTTDFEALCAYKRGDYQRCLQLSRQNAKVLLLSYSYVEDISTLSEFIPLFDDDIVSLKALTLIVKPNRAYDSNCDNDITQLTLSLYLITQCQLKLRHLLASLAETLHYTKVIRRNMPVRRTLDYLTLSLASRKIVMYIKAILQNR